MEAARYLTDKGFRIDVSNGALLVSPADRLTDDLRRWIQRRKPPLLAEASRIQAVPLSNEGGEKLADAILAAIADTGATADELQAALSDDDRADWRTGALGPANLRALALALHVRKQREAGQIPDGYDEIAECAHCGPVWLFTAGKV